MSKPSRISVIFHYDKKKHMQIVDITNLTAILHSDLLFIDEFKEPKKLDKKVWESNVTGTNLHIYLK